MSKKTEPQGIAMVATIIGEPRWDDVSGCAFFDVKNTPFVAPLDKKGLDATCFFHVACCGNSGKSVLPYLKEGVTVVFLGTLANNCGTLTIYTHSVYVCSNQSQNLQSLSNMLKSALSALGIPIEAPEGFNAPKLLED